MKTASMLIACAALAGCATDPAEEQAAAARAQARQDAYFAQLGQRCARYGFQPGTNGFAACVQQQDICENRRQRAQAQYYQNLSAMGDRPGKGLYENMRDAARGVDVAGLCH